MWDDLVRGAIGAVVLVDTRRLEDCFPAVDYFEEHAGPVRRRRQLLRRASQPLADDVREALAVPGDTPVLLTDARDRASTKMALLELVQHALARATAPSSRLTGGARDGVAVPERAQARHVAAVVEDDVVDDVRHGDHEAVRSGLRRQEQQGLGLRDDGGRGWLMVIRPMPSMASKRPRSPRAPR